MIGKCSLSEPDILPFCILIFLICFKKMPCQTPTTGWQRNNKLFLRLDSAAFTQSEVSGEVDYRGSRRLRCNGYR